ncbi:Hypothetical predicted protein [Olea europaea subsp. europaea]|uniref:Uncharacterized protein n=1 Tax=Olea europaea subsp. europaea TaxID=158383 RepID=A0A8S0T4E9_OLEEU|nr:Hypothetical predicted protein [Olea europaea subsp. europaea]
MAVVVCCGRDGVIDMVLLRMVVARDSDARIGDVMVVLEAMVSNHYCVVGGDCCGGGDEWGICDRQLVPKIQSLALTTSPPQWRRFESTFTLRSGAKSDAMPLCRDVSVFVSSSAVSGAASLCSSVFTVPD